MSTGRGETPALFVGGWALRSPELDPGSSVQAPRGPGSGPGLRELLDTLCASYERSQRGAGISGKDRGDPMSNAMTYQGYSARVEYDDEDGIFTGRIAGIRDGVAFHADMGGRPARGVCGSGGGLSGNLRRGG